MSRNGRALPHACVEALIDAGEVSRSEVERRKKERQINSPLDTLAALLPCSRVGRHLGFLTSRNNRVGTPHWVHLRTFRRRGRRPPFSHCRTDLLRCNDFDLLPRTWVFTVRMSTPQPLGKNHPPGPKKKPGKTTRQKLTSRHSYQDCLPYQSST